jgi:hypothetical protein
MSLDYENETKYHKYCSKPCSGAWKSYDSINDIYRDCKSVKNANQSEIQAPTRESVAN